MTPTDARPPHASPKSAANRPGAPVSAWWILALVLLAVRTILLVFSVQAGRGLEGDEPVYSSIAKNLLAGDGYGYQGHPWVWKPPGWPIVLAGLYRVLGTEARHIVFVQGLFDAGTILLYAWLAGRLFASTFAARLTFLLLLLWPPLFRESRFMATEPLFTFAVALTMCAFTKFVYRPGARAGLLAGMAAAVAALVRPTGIVIVMGMLLAWFLTLRAPRWPLALKGIPVVLGLALVLAPWTIRNARVFHAFIPVSTGGGELFYMGSTPETDGRWDHDKWPALFAAALDPVQKKLGRPVNAVERDKAFMQAGLENWKRDPAGSALITLKRFYRLCFVPLKADEHLWVRVGFLAAILAIYVLAVPVGLAGLRDPRPEFAVRAVLLITTVVYALSSSMFYANSRYFEPIRLLMLVLAAGAVAGMLTRGTSASPERRA